MTILCLSVGSDRLKQANLTFKQALTLGLKDQLIMEEIGDLYYGLQELDLSLIAYQQLTLIDGNYAEGLRKYAEVLEDPRCRNQNIDKAIEFFDKAL